LTEKLPNFFIVGAPRSGTTSLYDFLKRTKGIYMSPRKEPNYFSTSIDPIFLSPSPIRDEEKYLKLFQNVKNEKIIGEASPTYLRDPKAPQLIKKIAGNPKIVIILRDPIQRAYSHYLLRKSNGATYSFSEAIKTAINSKNDDFKARIINAGMYYEQVKRYIETFGSENVRIIIFEEFIIEPQKILKQIIDFLGIDSELPETVDLPHNLLTIPRNKFVSSLLQNQTMRKIGRKIFNQTSGAIMVKKILGKKISKPEMNNTDKIFLEELYREDVRNLEKLLGIKFPWFF